MSAWCIMLIVTALGIGAFLAGWQLIQAQERINAQQEEKIKAYEAQIKELNLAIEEFQQKIEAVQKEKEKLLSKIKELEQTIEEQEAEISRLSIMLSDKKPTGKKLHQKRPKILD